MQEALKHQYEKVQTNIPVVMDDLAKLRTVDDIRKAMQNCTRVEI